MSNQDRKAMIAAYKERKSVRGVFAVVCSSTGEVWVGTSRNLAAQQNSLWFGLRLGSSPFKTLQAEWNQQGEREFRFEELDRLSDDFSELLQKDELKKRQQLWASRLQATPI
ncbi:GIY-YIG nuclease family protein [Aestuariivirga litoralis]|uniref:GIY-YIG nuclease family protein n=1 Tax=Aestuariivirga litoralis TaxID=2650924 RepID=UPI0018C687B8|nr:GIY-YIG nuclease family protein [Aestuariivirga litoralis]MBG1230844.1 GIY-YIG nuclease family protein [Aestuariivirga litoralis]